MESLVVVAFQLCRLATATPGRSSLSPSTRASGRPQSLDRRLRGFGLWITAIRRSAVSSTVRSPALVSAVSRIDSPTKEYDLSILTISSDIKQRQCQPLPITQRWIL
jgi:hypothetical protein